ncbi:MAG: hypothetical protein ACLUI3_01570 [Christensenellales bacterium]
MSASARSSAAICRELTLSAEQNAKTGERRCFRDDEPGAGAWRAGGVYARMADGEAQHTVRLTLTKAVLGKSVAVFCAAAIFDGGKTHEDSD